MLKYAIDNGFQLITILPELKKRGFKIVNNNNLFKIKGKTNIPIGAHTHNMNDI